MCLWNTNSQAAKNLKIPILIIKVKVTKESFESVLLSMHVKYEVSFSWDFFEYACQISSIYILRDQKLYPKLHFFYR